MNETGAYKEISLGRRTQHKNNTNNNNIINLYSANNLQENQAHAVAREKQTFVNVKYVSISNCLTCGSLGH